MSSGIEAFGRLPAGGLSEILQQLNATILIAVDTETTSLEDKSLIGLSLSCHPDYGVWFAEDSEYFWIALNILRNPRIKKIFHNCKFDFDVLEMLGIDESNYEDTEILAYTLNLPQKLYNLGSYLGRTVEDKFFNWVFPKGSTMLEIYQQDPNFTIQKCCIDSALTLWCWYKLCESQIPEAYFIDRDVVHILRHMEHEGVRLNETSVAEFNDVLVEDTDYLRVMIQSKFGCDPNSNMQVGTVLAQRGWRLPYTKSKKQLRVGEEIIRDIPDVLAQIVLVYREKAKILNTYCKPLLNLDRAYTHYNNTRVVTGRLSSSDPINMQNIPNFFRVVFLADEDDWLFSMDASQAELRAIAFMAQDKKMMEVFNRNGDIHEATNQLLGLKNRKVAKTLNFAVAYLGEEETIMENAKDAGVFLTKPEATDFRTRYFNTYTGVRDYIYSQREQITKYGIVKTFYGRVRKADPVRMQSPYSREAVIRELFNMPIQGTIAEIIKKYMIKASNYDMRIQVHDEMVFNGNCPNPNIFDGLSPFPLPVELKIGQSWGEDMVKIKY